MATYTLRRDGDKDVRFEGEIIAEVDNSWTPNGPANRWNELTLYETNTGKLICHEINHSRWQGEETTYDCHICSSEIELINVLNDSFEHLPAHAKELLKKAGIECVEIV